MASLPTLAQNVGLNADGTTAHPPAILDMRATDKGVLVPRMTAAQRTAIATPATGLLVYQADGAMGFYYFDGIAWVVLTPGRAKKILGLVYGMGAAPASPP